MSRAEFISQSVEYVGGYGGAESIESAARTSTQTDAKGNAVEFVRSLLKRGHLSPFEFGYADMKIECDRAIQQELTRHRHFSFLIESTRWINYTKKPIRFVTKPPKGMRVSEEAVELLEEFCELAVDVYDALLALGAPRDYARKALTLALASKMRMAGNLRTWLEMLPKRIGPTVHKEAKEVATKTLEILLSRFVGVFDALSDELSNEIHSDE
jgi:thymidylate synthase (FAD)